MTEVKQDLFLNPIDPLALNLEEKKEALPKFQISKVLIHANSIVASVIGEDAITLKLGN